MTNFQTICYFLLSLLVLCQAQSYYWQPIQNITDNLYDGIVPDITSAEYNGTHVIIWAHAGTLHQAISFDNGTTWYDRVLNVQNEPISLFGAFTNPTVKYAEDEWILIFTSTDIPYRSLTVSVKANPLFSAWEYIDHQERDFGAGSWDEVTEMDNSLVLGPDGLWLASSLDNNTLKIQHNWTSIADCSTGVFSQELISDGQVVYQTADGIYRVNASDCSSHELITSHSADFFIVEANDNYMMILETGEVYLSLNGIDWDQRTDVKPGAFAAKFLGDHGWMVLAENYTCITDNNGANWQYHLDNTPTSGVLTEQPQLSLIWMQPPYLQKTTREELIAPTTRVEINTTVIFVVDHNQTIEGDLQLDGSLVVNHNTLKIEGNLIMNVSSALSVEEGAIEIGGNLTANGRLNITAVQKNTTIITFNDIDGEFNEVEKLPCQTLEYARHALTVAFASDCNENVAQGEISKLHLWQIVTIAGGVSLAVLGAVVSVTVFRKQIFPFRDREYYDN